MKFISLLPFPNVVNLQLNLVGMIQTSLKNNAIVDSEEEERDREQNASVMGDIQLQSPVQSQGTPATGQVNPQQFQALFPNDPTGAAIAQRGVRRG